MYQSEVTVWIKKPTDGEYLIGNCDLDFNMKNTVVFVFPPDGDRPGKIVIRTKKEREQTSDLDIK